MAKRRKSRSARDRGRQAKKGKAASHRRSVPSAIARPVLAAFCLSGFAALMHQVVWAKLLVQLIGATAYAQVVVLAVFMGGLALGRLSIRSAF